MAVTTIDEARAGEFAGEMVSLLNHAMLSLMISVGHRTELFDRLAGLPPSTSEEIATACRPERALRPGVAQRDDGRAHRASTTRSSGPTCSRPSTPRR